MLKHASRLQAASLNTFALVLCIVAHCAARGQSSSALQPAEFIQRIDAAVNARFNGLAGYTVQEHYAIYRNGAKAPVAEMTVQTVYTQATGKEYTPISENGSEFFRKTIIEKILANEHEINLPANRAASWITSSNYEMGVAPVRVTRNGHDCFLVTLKPRRKGPSLFIGRAWFDASDGTLVRLEGAQSQPPSFFAGDTTVSRDYVPLDGFAMASHAEAHSHSFLLGDTLLTIDYSGYQLQHAPLTQAQNGGKH